MFKMRSVCQQVKDRRQREGGAPHSRPLSSHSLPPKLQAENRLAPGLGTAALQLTSRHQCAASSGNRRDSPGQGELPAPPGRGQSLSPQEAGDSAREARASQDSAPSIHTLTQGDVRS